MFFIMGISDGRKQLDFSQMSTCPACGAYCRYQLFVTYTALSLFFIPIWKWNRRYVVESSCCGAAFELCTALGQRIERGESVEIRPEDLRPLGGGRSNFKRCAHCGYATAEDFAFCPKCGQRFE